MKNKHSCISRIALALALLLISISLTAQTTDNKTLLANIDQYRLFQTEGFSFQYSVSDSSDPVAGESVMKVSLKKQDKNTVLCMYLSPADQRGRKILVQNNSFWMMDSHMRDPIRISSRQMMFGQASAGDITRLSYTSSYQVDSSSFEGDTTILQLSALKNVEVSYPTIRLVVRTSDARPIHAELFAASGALLKTIDYQDYATFNDKVLLTGFIITNALNKETSRVKLSKFSQDTLPDRFFSQGGMKVSP